MKESENLSVDNKTDIRSDSGKEQISLLERICAVARQAGEIMREAHPESAGVIRKEGHANFVTEYDSRVQQFLFEKLSSLLPEASFVGEEDGKAVFLDSYRRGYTFVVDPIDGTSNFMRHYRPCTTSIGLLHDGAPYIGVVYAPFSDRLFAAGAGCGAYENGRELHTSADPLSRSLVTMGTAPYNSDKSHRAFTLAEAYLPRCIDIRRSGSASWDLCMVASGRIGLYFEPLIHLHDYAAGALIAMEAGAAVTDFDGNPLSFTGATAIAAATAGVASEIYLPSDIEAL